MIKIKLNDLQPGMITAAPVYNQKGLLLMPENTVLTTQQIAHLAYYNTYDVYVFPEEELEASGIDILPDVETEPLTYSQKVKRSPEFQKFKASYSDKVDLLHESLNDVITRNQPINQKQILSEVNTLYKGHSTTLSLFDMLHNMRQIDDSTYAHSVNVSLIARMIGQWLHFSEQELDILTMSGLMHDIGKCMIDPDIIQKPGKLTNEEFKEIQKHPRIGCDILKKQDLDIRVKYSALMHHERSDGTGYPLSLKGDQIDDFAQIISIADVYDAMTANRCYRKGLCPFEVIATFEREGLHKYNPKYILTFLEHVTDSYMNNTVQLSDGRHGRIVLSNRRELSRPIVEVTNGSFINLHEHRELYIDSII